MLRTSLLTVFLGTGLVCAAPSRALAAESPALDSSIVLPEDIFPALKPILRDAALQAPRALSANLEYIAAQEMLISNRARLLPTVAGNGTYSVTRDERLDNPDLSGQAATKLSYSASMSQPVFHWGALRDQYNAGKINIKIAEKNYAEAYRLLVLEIRASYLRMVVSKAALGRAKAVQKMAESEVRLAQSKLDRGAISPAEMFTPRLRLEEATLDSQIAAEDYRFTKTTFERLAAIQPLAEEDVPALVPNLPYSETVISAQLTQFLGSGAAEENPRVAVQQYRLEQEKLNYHILATNLRPKFNLVTGVSQDETLSDSSQPDSTGKIPRIKTRSFYAGLNVGWTLFDGFSTKAQKRVSLVRQRQFSTLVEDGIREVMEQARNQAKLVDFAAKRTSFSEARLANIDRLVAYKQEDVKRGYTSQADADNVALARDEILIATMRERIAYFNRLTEFLSTIGRDPALANLSTSRK